MCYPASMTAQAGHFKPGEGRRYTLGRIALTFKPADSGGAYALVEAIEPPGSGAGLHRHPTYDEMHIIVAGAYECRLGDETLSLRAGEMMFAPRGTPHSIKSLGPEAGRELIISSPGGTFEAFIAEVTAAIAATPERPADFRGIAGKYGIEFME